MFLLPKEGALIAKQPIYLKDHKVDQVKKIDSTSGKVDYLTLLSFYSKILVR